MRQNRETRAWSNSLEEPESGSQEDIRPGSYLFSREAVSYSSPAAAHARQHKSCGNPVAATVHGAYWCPFRLIDDVEAARVV